MTFSHVPQRWRSGFCQRLATIASQNRPSHEMLAAFSADHLRLLFFSMQLERQGFSQIPTRYCGLCQCESRNLFAIPRPIVGDNSYTMRYSLRPRFMGCLSLVLTTTMFNIARQLLRCRSCLVTTIQHERTV